MPTRTSSGPVHVPLLLLPLLVLPISLQGKALPPAEANPIPWLLGVLILTAALPFFAVTTTAPLLQRWFASTPHPHASDPYFLYAASNLGSLLALLSYPLVVERHLSLTQQSRLWGTGYQLTALVIAVCGVAAVLFNSRSAEGRLAHGGVAARFGTIAPERERSHSVAGSGPLRWVFYAFLPSSLLLGVTQYISTDIAVVPLLWVVPFSLYLLSFILVFARRPLLPHGVALRIFPGILVALVLLMMIRATQPVAVVFPVHLITFFFAALVYHGELVRLRPPATDLTKFYLWIAIGGLLGGFFNALVAPLLFTGVVEYPLVLFLAALAMPATEQTAKGGEMRRGLALAGALLLLVVIVPLVLRGLGLTDEMGTARTPLYAVAVVLCYLASRNRRHFGFAIGGLLLVVLAFPGSLAGRPLFAHRTFFGVSRVLSIEREGEVYHTLTHGTTRHGLQSTDQERRDVPLLYYHPMGPSGDIFRLLNERDGGVRVGAIGLGSGALAAYARAGQEWTYYEIDPVVARIAADPEYFTYLSDSAAEWRVVLGDGRLSIARAPEASFDLVVVDAYGSDAIPVHMLTREAVRLFSEKLTPDGMIAFHISNQFLDLESVVHGIAESLSLHALVRTDDAITPDEQVRGRVASTWVAVARQSGILEPLKRLGSWRALRGKPDARVWTDEFTDLWSIIRWR